MVSHVLYHICGWAHFPCRLQPFLHCRVRLDNDRVAKGFVDYQLVKLTPANVEELYSGPSINILTAADALRVCLKTRELTICFSYQHIQDYKVNPLLGLLKVLRALRSLHVELATVGDPEVCYLPEYPVFHQLTHLHLAVAMDITFPMIPLGLSRLSNLTHLSLCWYMARSCTSGLQGFLVQGSSLALVLWYSGSSGCGTLENNLESHNLADRQVVLL